VDAVNRDVWVHRIPISELTVSLTNSFPMPTGARLLHCAEQHQDSIALWFEVDTEAPQERRQFQIFGTGMGPIRDGLEYRGTAIFTGGSLVLHAYEVTA
jgi:hypothetical protein